MKEWFSQLDQREQMSLLVLGVVLVLYLLYMLVWSPLADKRDQMALQNSAIAESQVRVDAMVSELLQLRAGGVQTGSRRNLTSVINESTSRLQLPVIRLQLAAEAASAVVSRALEAVEIAERIMARRGIRRTSSYGRNAGGDRS